MEEVVVCPGGKVGWHWGVRDGRVATVQWIGPMILPSVEVVSDHCLLTRGPGTRGPGTRGPGSGQGHGMSDPGDPGDQGGN